MYTRATTTLYRYSKIMLNTPMCLALCQLYEKKSKSKNADIIIYCINIQLIDILYMALTIEYTSNVKYIYLFYTF